jgi:hypothetical protein
MTPPARSAEPLPYDFSLVADLHGTFALEMTLRFENLHMREIESRIGNLSLFNDGGIHLRFPTPVSPLQGGVVLTYMNWQLPRMGPLIMSTALEGGMSYIQGQGWELNHSLGLDFSHVRAQWISIGISGNLGVVADPSWRHFTVEPTMSFGITFHCLPERGSFRRRR